MMRMLKPTIVPDAKHFAAMFIRWAPRGPATYLIWNSAAVMSQHCTANHRIQNQSFIVCIPMSLETPFFQSVSQNTKGFYLKLKKGD